MLCQHRYFRRTIYMLPMAILNLSLVDEGHISNLRFYDSYFKGSLR